MAADSSPVDQPFDQPPGTIAQADLKASDADRERVVTALRDASADGRLTPDELGQRLEAALFARTLGELAALTADLGWPMGHPGKRPLRARSVIRIDQRGGSLAHTGPWSVPRRFELRPVWCDVTLDFTEAVINHDKLRIDMRMKGGALILVTRPGILVDANDLQVRYTDVRIGSTPDPGASVLLHIELTGRMRYGRIETYPSSPASSASPGSVGT